MARLHITFDDELKAAMDEIEHPPNWSSIAAAAFREFIASAHLAKNRRTKSMKTVIERMKAADERDSQKIQKLGFDAGVAWAREHATPRELRRLAEQARSPDGLRVGYGTPDRGLTWGDWLMGAMRGWSDPITSEEDRPQEGEFGEIVGDDFEDFHNDTDFVQGVADGALSVWDEVESKV